LTTAGLWDELGIAPCHDAKVIRRAYAARLKQLDPDRNPEAFARLRRAFEWALSGAGQPDRPAAAPLLASQNGDAPLQESTDASTDESSEAADEDAGRDNARPAAHPDAQADLQPSARAPDRDDIRDRGLLATLDAALQQRDATVATALYYRAAATGALSLQSADVIGRLIAVAVDDARLSGTAFRDLIRTVGWDASWSRRRIDAELRRRVMARLAAEDWYDNLLATAQQRKGRTARYRAKIARLLLGRIGRYWHPGVDKTALRSWLTQYNTHAAWLEDRIDPAWPKKLEQRLRRREIFWHALYLIFVGNVLIQLLVLFAASVVEGGVDYWAVTVGAAFFSLFAWIFVLLVQKLMRLANPGFRARWNRSKARETGDVG
jgi:hypothetical protein